MIVNEMKKRVEYKLKPSPRRERSRRRVIFTILKKKKKGSCFVIISCHCFLSFFLSHTFLSFITKNTLLIYIIGWLIQEYRRSLQTPKKIGISKVRASRPIQQFREVVSLSLPIQVDTQMQLLKRHLQRFILLSLRNI